MDLTLPPLAPGHDAMPLPSVLEVLARAVSAADLPAAASQVASELASHFGCERVCVGWLDDGRIDLVAASDGTPPKRQAEQGRLIAEAMHEAVLQKLTLVQPWQDPDGRAPILVAHAALARHGETAAVLTVPLLDADGAALGALSCGRALPFCAAERGRIEDIAAFAAPLLALRRLADRGVPDRLRDAAVRLRHRLLGAGHAGAKLAVLGGLAVLGASLLPVSLRLPADARLDGSVHRVLSAPADGYLRQVHVRPGDTVKAGQLLAELDDEDLQLELRRLQAGIAQHDNAQMQALVARDRGQAAMVQSRLAEAEAELALVRQRLSRTRITAPMDGVVIQGDLSQALGAPVRRGDMLLTLAPGTDFRLVLAVDERDIGLVQPGQRGRLALAAAPERPVHFSVVRITPVAITRDGRNLFEAEGRLDADAGMALRPGLQGVAQIDAGSGPLAAVPLRRGWAWLRLQWWAWWG